MGSGWKTDCRWRGAGGKTFMEKREKEAKQEDRLIGYSLAFALFGKASLADWWSLVSI